MVTYAFMGSRQVYTHQLVIGFDVVFILIHQLVIGFDVVFILIHQLVI